MTVGTHYLKTPLYEDHLLQKAKMIPFGGWWMPVQYAGILAEYQQTRNAVSLFDTSHMGEFVVEGDYLESGLDRIVTMSLKDLPVNACRYGMILNDQGCVIDDCIIFRQEKDKWFIVVNGATAGKDKLYFQRNINDKAQFTDISLQTGKIDVQGPLARDIMIKIVDGIEKLDYYTFDNFHLLDEEVLISRTGYTGELGYEIYLSREKTSALWNKLLTCDQVKPAGLGARDLLRLEMGYSLYGHELTEDISPIEAGLKRFVDWNKDFIGKEELKKKSDLEEKKIVGLISRSRRSPRENHKLFSENGDEIGFVTSGTFSPSLNQGIGLGYVISAFACEGATVYFGDDKNKIEANIAKRNFYKNGSLKN